jgi:hypothetical protein
MTDEHAGSSKDRIGTERSGDCSSGLARVLLAVVAAGVLVTALACTAAARPDRTAAKSPASVPAAGSGVASAAAPVQQKAAHHGPSIVVAGGTTYDFGKVWPTKENLKHTFKLTNTGDAVLKILHVQPG